MQRSPRTSAAVKPSDGYDQSPRWFSRHLIDSGAFADYDALAFKLLFWVINKREWERNGVQKLSTDMTPWTNVEELALILGACWRRTNQAMRTLAESGVISIQTKKREKRFKLIRKNPYAHDVEQDLRSPQRVDVPLNVSVDVGSPSELYDDSAGSAVQFVRPLCPKMQASDDPFPDELPTWVTESGAPGDSGHAPGGDA